MNRLRVLLARLLVVTLVVRFVIVLLIALCAVAAFGILR
jgi:hypothetical protein